MLRSTLRTTGQLGLAERRLRAQWAAFEVPGSPGPFLTQVAQNFYSAVYSGYLSDGTSLVLVRTTNGPNYDHKIYTSVDSGATWTLAFTPVTNVSSAIDWKVIGNSIYGVLGTGTINNAMLFYRVDYSGGTFSLGANGVSIEPSDVAKTYSAGAIEKDPTGRLWISYVFFDGAWNHYYVKYSGDNGATWSTSNDLSGQINNTAETPELIALDQRLVLIAVKPSGGFVGDTYFGYYSRLHTDTPTTWAAWNNVLDIGLLGVTSELRATPLVASPQRTILGAITNRTLAPAVAWAFRFVQDGAGNLSVIVSDDSNKFTAPTTQDVYGTVTGFTDGAEFYYVFGSSLGTVRARTISPTAVASALFGAEATKFTANPALSAITQISSFRSFNDVIGQRWGIEYTGAGGTPFAYTDSFRLPPL